MQVVLQDAGCKMHRRLVDAGSKMQVGCKMRCMLESSWQGGFSGA